MSRKYFGTDGIRGKVGVFPITPEFVLKLGYAAGCVLAAQCESHRHRPTVLVGKDTRVSGYMLESALEAGFSAAGVDVLLAGPLPTPAIAYLTQALRLTAGVVISASHNPYYDNGIKFFSADGFKLDDALEQEIEDKIQAPLLCVESECLGKARRLEDARGRYIEFCKSTFPKDLNLRGLRIVVDSAFGACYGVAFHVFHELGAEVIPLHDQPDGFNINAQCGATAPQALHASVLQASADIGIGLDGDGDRLVLIDANGRLYDGDDILWIIAQFMHQRGILRGVVGTVMSNLALEQRVSNLGAAFVRTKVGDRHVIEKMKQTGFNLGGENSGHIVCSDCHTTGDGLIAALQVLIVMAWHQCGLADIPNQLQRYPQVMMNVSVKNIAKYKEALPATVLSSIAQAEHDLNMRGRILVRPSGTEALLRVMVEGEDSQLIGLLAHKIADSIRIYDQVLE